LNEKIRVLFGERGRNGLSWTINIPVTEGSSGALNVRPPHHFSEVWRSAGAELKRHASCPNGSVCRNPSGVRFTFEKSEWLAVLREGRVFRNSKTRILRVPSDGPFDQIGS
jgi:hypothetical protein